MPNGCFQFYLFDYRFRIHLITIIKYKLMISWQKNIANFQIFKFFFLISPFYVSGKHGNGFNFIGNLFLGNISRPRLKKRKQM